MALLWECFRCGAKDARTRMGAIYCADCDERLSRARCMGRSVRSALFAGVAGLRSRLSAASLAETFGFRVLDVKQENMRVLRLAQERSFRNWNVTIRVQLCFRCPSIRRRHSRSVW